MALLDCLIKRVIPVNDAITFLSENCYPVNGHATSFSVINKSYFLQMPCSIKMFWKPIDEVNEFLENSPNVIISFTLITFLRGRPPWEKLNFVMESIILGNFSILRIRSSEFLLEQLTWIRGYFFYFLEIYSCYFLPQRRRLNIQWTTCQKSSFCSMVFSK